MEGVGRELALASVGDHVVAVAEARVAGVPADPAHAGRVGVDVGGADVAAAPAVGEVVGQADAGRTARAAHERDAAVRLRAGELAAPVGADLARAAHVTAAAAGALRDAGVDLAPVDRVVVAVRVAGEADEAASARRAGRRRVVARRADRATGAAAGEVGAGVSLAAVARGAVAVGEPGGAHQVATAAEADRRAVGAYRADVAAGSAVGDLATRVGLAPVALVPVAARRARGAGERNVDQDWHVDDDGSVGGCAGVDDALAGAEARTVREAGLYARHCAGTKAACGLVHRAGEGGAGVGGWRVEVDARPAGRGQQDAHLSSLARHSAVGDAHPVLAALVEGARRAGGPAVDGRGHPRIRRHHARVGVHDALAAPGRAVEPADLANPASGVAALDAPVAGAGKARAARRRADRGRVGVHLDHRRVVDVAGIGGKAADVRRAPGHDGQGTQEQDTKQTGHGMTP